MLSNLNRSSKLVTSPISTFCILSFNELLCCLLIEVVSSNSLFKIFCVSALSLNLCKNLIFIDKINENHLKAGTFAGDASV